MNIVRIGLIGLGGIGMNHLNYMDRLEGATLTAVCDIDPSRLELATTRKPDLAKFTDYHQLLQSGAVDAVLIATPHYLHPQIAQAAFDCNLHVLCEKPVAVTVGQARKLNQAAAHKPHLKFAVMFMMRTNGHYAKIRDLVTGGELGRITRLTWIITDWFRTHRYYASGGWRATWAGEGGGVLINQCPHNLDLIWWITQMMPRRVTAVAMIGKTHPIEVEDEVSAILEFADGATGHFITSTGEAPGTNRLEICGDRGKLVFENGQLLFRRTRTSVSEYNRTSPERFRPPEVWDVTVPIRPGPQDPWKAITQNFVNAILKDEPLIAPGIEGVYSLELGNAMLMAGLTRKPVDLPLHAEQYDLFLQELIQRSRKEQ